MVMPDLGLVLLLVFLRWRRGVPTSVEAVGSVILQHLGLLFVPASVGVVLFAPQLRTHGAALLVTLVLTLAAYALGLKAWAWPHTASAPRATSACTRRLAPMPAWA